MSKWHQSWDKKEEINYKKLSTHAISIMHACKFSDLFSYQLCMWLIQLIVLCSLTFFLLSMSFHALHSVKYSSFIHFHQLVCWVIITLINSRQQKVYTDFCIICSVCFIKYTKAVCMITHLVVHVHFLSAACCFCLNLAARTGECERPFISPSAAALCIFQHCKEWSEEKMYSHFCCTSAGWSGETRKK